jgi:hypothetical protein
MVKLVSRVRRWWRPGSRRFGIAAPYEVACACGNVLRGQRQARHQVVRCGACHQPVFVLPYSPLPRWSAADVPASGGDPAPPAARAAALRFWRWPLIAGGLTLAVLVAVFTVCLVVLRPVLHPVAGETAPPAPSLESLVEAGRKELKAGEFVKADRSFQEAHALLRPRPELARTETGRQLVQLGREADLLANLLREPLGEIIQIASVQKEDEWKAQFDQHYLHQAVIFDADVVPDGAGKPRLDFVLRAGDLPARIDVGDLKLLAALPRERPPRLLFGARLASIAREVADGRGVWVVRFDPDSGVLFTDPEAVADAYPPPGDNDAVARQDYEALQALLKRQRRWLDELP